MTSAPPEPFEMNAMERDSPLWRRFAQYVDQRIEVLRNENDGNKSETDTAHLRGRIAQLKAIKALGSEPRA